MFGIEFFPTPPEVIQMMLESYNLEGKTILEPSAGSGNIIQYCKDHFAKDVLYCEIDRELQKIASTKGRFLEMDFFDVKSDQVSHVDFIIMNPPFSNADKHILHAWQIAPPGCKIISLCNSETIKKTYSRERAQLSTILEENGTVRDFGNCFSAAARQTEVNVSCVFLQKPGSSYASEFEGFFMEEEPDEKGTEGIMSYNVVRDLVNRYIAAIKLFDQQIELGIKMNDLTDMFSNSKISFTCTEQEKPKTRNDFKKDLQKNAWNWIFGKMNMQKHSTAGLRQDINKFVEQQQNIPFTMKNIYRMLEIVIGTTSQRMDKALLEVFDKLTRHYDENRYNVEGWKTNSHYLVNRKFICTHLFETNFRDGISYKSYKSDGEMIGDLEKALCYLTGENYDEIKTIYECIPSNARPGIWYEAHFFRIKGFKKGTGHIEFKTEKLWEQFNSRIAKIKGYPLFEHRNSTSKKQSPKENQFNTPLF